MRAKSKLVLDPGRRVRILIVDDSVAIRHLISLSLEGDPSLEIVGTASNGKQALERAAGLTPDLITLDIEMPEMDGLEALRHLRNLLPQVRVVMLSALTERGGAATLEALSLGADDYVTKLSAGKTIEDSKLRLRSELVPKIKQFFTFSNAFEAGNLRLQGGAAPANYGSLVAVEPVLCRYEQVPRVVAIGVSTGGPTALATILHEIPADFKLPILIVQHMPPLFTKLLCERLGERLRVPIREAVHDEPVRPGIILMAPGDRHMRVKCAAGDVYPRIALDQSPPENSCRPAVDPLFESLASVYGGAVCVAILTGMGHDGLRGAKLLRKAGATIFAQDEESSAVWGMPRAIVEAKIADAVLPLHEIIPQILRRCTRLSHFPERALQEIPTVQETR